MRRISRDNPLILAGEIILVKFDVILTHKWTFLDGDSGDGKTYLLNRMRELSQVCGFSYVLLNDLSPKCLPDNETYDLVCVDNADLFLDQALVDTWNKLPYNYLVSMRNTSKIYVSDYECGKIKFPGTTLSYIPNNF